MTKRLDVSIQKMTLARCDSCFSDEKVEKVVLHSTGKSFCICKKCKIELADRFSS